MKESTKARIAASGGAVLIGVTALTGCGQQECADPTACAEPIHVVAQVDASPSTPDDETYWNAFIDQLEAHQGQRLTVDLMAVGATADPAEVCPTVKGAVVAAEPAADNQELSWTRSARGLVADAKVVFECAGNAQSTPGSIVAAFEQARGSDHLWLFTDAMFNSGDVRVKARRLADAAYVKALIAELPAGDALSGVEVGVFGAGVNQGLTNEEMAGLRDVVTAAVEAQEGTLSEWVTL
jgi:hypothetical protein